MPPKKVYQLSHELKEKWNNMTKEEKFEATKDHLEKMEQMKEMRVYSKHTVKIAACRDVQCTLARVGTEVWMTY